MTDIILITFCLKHTLLGGWLSLKVKARGQISQPVEKNVVKMINESSSEGLLVNSCRLVGWR